MVKIIDIELFQGCKHRSIILDEEALVAKCKKCGEIINPMAYIIGLAKEQEENLYQKDLLKHEKQSLEFDIKYLKKEKEQLERGIDTQRKINNDINTPKNSTDSDKRTPKK